MFTNDLIDSLTFCGIQQIFQILYPISETGIVLQRSLFPASACRVEANERGVWLTYQKGGYKYVNEVSHTLF